MNLTETGVATLCIGIVFFVLGGALLFDRALVIAGNGLIVAGFLLLARSHMLSLLHPEKLIGTLFFFVGVAVMFFRQPFLGFVLEICGLAYILKGSMPSLRSVLMKMLYGKAVKRS